MNAFARLSVRERVLVLGCGAALIILGLWLYVWQPIVVNRTTQTARIARYLTLIEIAGDTDNVAVRIAPVTVDDTPLASRVTQSAEATGIPLARLDPNGAQLMVTVASTSYVEAISWIAALESDSNVRALSVQISRLTEPGRVSLRMTLEDAV